MKTQELIDYLVDNNWKHKVKTDYIEIEDIAGVGVTTQDLYLFEFSYSEEGIELLKKLIEYKETPILERQNPPTEARQRLLELLEKNYDDEEFIDRLAAIVDEMKEGEQNDN